ncbi:hypothetical protein VP01_1748g5 [Puccinia sorghi]|uniref:Uncharacterized protein n=1 Tax=Puccinia sorghi TaxID=27349 RepID=A0A0L6VFQ1_9BASI|nr:hypothetical protein VP01_1748g5 [Puccinia sorghi]
MTMLIESTCMQVNLGTQCFWARDINPKFKSPDLKREYTSKQNDQPNRVTSSGSSTPFGQEILVSSSRGNTQASTMNISHRGHINIPDITQVAKLVINATEIIMPILFLQYIRNNTSKKTCSTACSLHAETPWKLLLLLQPYSKMTVPKHLNMQKCGFWMAAWLEHAACQLHALNSRTLNHVELTNMCSQLSYSMIFHIINLTAHLLSYTSRTLRKLPNTQKLSYLFWSTSEAHMKKVNSAFRYCCPYSTGFSTNNFLRSCSCHWNPFPPPSTLLIVCTESFCSDFYKFIPCKTPPKVSLITYNSQNIPCLSQKEESFDLSGFSSLNQLTPSKNPNQILINTHSTISVCEITGDGRKKEGQYLRSKHLGFRTLHSAENYEYLGTGEPPFNRCCMSALIHCKQKLTQLPAVDMQHSPAKLQSKLHILVGSLLEKGWSNNRSFLGCMSTVGKKDFQDLGQILKISPLFSYSILSIICRMILDPILFNTAPPKFQTLKKKKSTISQTPTTPKPQLSTPTQLKKPSNPVNN